MDGKLEFTPGRRRFPPPPLGDGRGEVPGGDLGAKSYCGQAGSAWRGLRRQPQGAVAGDRGHGHGLKQGVSRLFGYFRESRLLAVGGRFKAVIGFWFDLRCLSQNIQHLLGASTTGSKANLGIRLCQCDALRKNRGYKGIKRHAIFAGERFGPLSHGIWDGNGQGTHSGGKIHMKSFGVKSRLEAPNCERRPETRILVSMTASTEQLRCRRLASQV